MRFHLLFITFQLRRQKSLQEVRHEQHVEQCMGKWKERQAEYCRFL
ncbi:YrzI family small protein [Ectobacillus ponti]|uniref:YrzI family small protein n=1 Tax=Ectobacillus ponti TaxID=2961894 RepID=A0AA41X8R2_9BACI|nr:YrzI family small protein [Ectobacillus ponti]MCP8968378.1 YrzI family small protein [Ectobacillus ponti]